MNFPGNHELKLFAIDVDRRRDGGNIHAFERESRLDGQRDFLAGRELQAERTDRRILAEKLAGEFTDEGGFRCGRSGHGFGFRAQRGGSGREEQGEKSGGEDWFHAQE